MIFACFALSELGGVRNVSNVVLVVECAEFVIPTNKSAESETLPSDRDRAKNLCAICRRYASQADAVHQCAQHQGISCR